jgi:hypothetical protein
VASPDNVNPQNPRSDFHAARLTKNLTFSVRASSGLRCQSAALRISLSIRTADLAGVMSHVKATREASAQAELRPTCAEASASWRGKPRLGGASPYPTRHGLTGVTRGSGNPGVADGTGGTIIGLNSGILGGSGFGVTTGTGTSKPGFLTDAGLVFSTGGS